jgi:hypothetical protein
MPNDYDALSKRIRRKVYSSTDELAKDVAQGLASISRQPEVDRGIKDQTIADVQGCTSLGVGDNSAANPSAYLVQNPQTGLPTDVGSGLKTRRQSRIMSNTKLYSAKVLETASAGATEVSVMIVGSEPVKGQDAATGIQTVADANAPIQSGVDSIIGQRMMAKMTGQPIVPSGTGIQPIQQGTTVVVAVNTQHEVTTTWTRRDRKNLPTVTNALKCNTACLVNGLACAGRGVCFPRFVSPDNDNIFTDAAYPSGNDWTYANDNLSTDDAGRPWGVFVIGTDKPSGTLDRASGDIIYYDNGVVSALGTITFTGIPWSYASANNYYTQVVSNNLAQIYSFILLIGCATGQSVDFGTFDTGVRSWADPSLRRSWVIRDSNFPIPL